MLQQLPFFLFRAPAVAIGRLMLCCWSLAALPVQAQKFNFVNYNVEDGLIQSQAVAFAQDKNHELWIGTFGGVSRFDGTHFINYNKGSGLPHNMVTDVLCDQQGYMWVATSLGVCRFDGRKMLRIPFERGVVPEQVQKIVQDGKGHIWILMSGRLYQYEKGVWVKNRSHEGVTSITIDQIGKLWVSVFQKGIYVLNEAGWSREIAYVQEDGAVVYQMLFGAYSGTLYCLTEKGIRIAGQKNKLIPPDWLAALPAEHMALSLLETSRGELWVSFSDGGAWKYNRKTWTHYTFSNGMADDQVYSFFEDIEHNIWIASNGNGIFRYGGGLFSYFDRSSGLTAPGIMSIAQNREGTTYFGGHTAGLYRLSKTGELQKMEMPVGQNKVNTLLMDGQDRLWIGTPEQEGLIMYDGQHFTKVEAKGTFVSGITHLLQDSNIIWMSAQTGLYKVVDDKVSRLPVFLEGIYTAVRVGKDSLLLGSIKGAFIFRTDKQQILNTPLVPEATVLCIKVDGPSVYIGTDDRGVVVWNKENNTQYTIGQKDGLSCDYVYSLLLDRDGSLWVGTGCGIDKITFAAGGKHIVNFGRSDGLLGVETNANASFEGRDGMLWFGTSRGLFVYNPNMARPAVGAPKMLLQSVQLFSRDIPDHQFADSTLPFSGIPFRPHFPHKQNHLTFTYKGVYLSNPEKIRYRYQLVGADESYTETNLTTVVYPNLPPGSYVFTVWSSDGDGRWQRNAVSYPFIIQTPYYQTPVFRLAIGLLAIGSLLAIVYWRNRQKTARLRWEARLREEEQARVRQKTAEDFHDEIGNKLTRINLLATIAGSKTGQDEVKGLLGQIQKNVTSLYHGAKDIIWSLQPESDYLDEILFHIRENTSNMLQDLPVQFSYEQQPGLSTHVKLPIDYSRNLIMIFKEAINNILKHAAARHITLEVTGDGKGLFTLVLSDDGQGFIQEATSVGNGLNNMRNRAARIHSRLWMDSETGKGTRLTLLLRAAFK